MIFEVLIIIHIFLAGFKDINIQLAGALKKIGINAIPEEKICPSCEIKLMSFKDDGPGEEACSQIYEDKDIELATNKFLKENLNSSLTSMNISPLKMHAVTGKKDFVRIAQRSHMQKYLILSNLKELYAKFKTSYPDIKIFFIIHAHIVQNFMLLKERVEHLIVR